MRIEPKTALKEQSPAEQGLLRSHGHEEGQGTFGSHLLSRRKRISRRKGDNELSPLTRGCECQLAELATTQVILVGCLAAVAAAVELQTFKFTEFIVCWGTPASGHTVAIMGHCR